MSVNNKAPKESLRDVIYAIIDDRGGWISFEEFMRLSLYEPHLGYYESEHVFGAQGDFVTGADMGPWLGLGFADLVCWAWQQLGSPKDWCLLEQGGGSGRLLKQVIQTLAERDMPMPGIVCIEASRRMQDAQKNLLGETGAKVSMFESWQDLNARGDALLRLPDGKRMPVVMLSNELPDAFPVRCFVKRGSALVERGVACKEGAFVWQEADQPLEPDALAVDQACIDGWPEGYISEWNPNLKPWQQDVSAWMQQGIVLTVDYGYAQQEYYRPNRQEGTLMGHRSHEVVNDVLRDMWQYAGAMDLTAHIDFTMLAHIGLACDMRPLVFTTQGAWLAQSPSVQERVQRCAQNPSVESMREVSFAKQLLMPFGMGETFKLLVQCKGVEDVAPPAYLTSFDHLNKLRF